MSSSGSPYLPIADYGLIGDGSGAALVSREGSIDWCCLPRFDSGSCFGRILDHERGGHCSIEVEDGIHSAFREYEEGTMALDTILRGDAGEVRIRDVMVLAGDDEPAPSLLLRLFEGGRGQVDVRVEIVPRFDYGDVDPWVRQEGVGVYSAIGGDEALVISCDGELEQASEHTLEARLSLRSGERGRLAIQYRLPHEIDRDRPGPLIPEEIDRRVDQTVARWRRWAKRAHMEGADAPGAIRSALVLKALTHHPTGAIVAAPTTSLPEIPGADRNWDYRYSWVRDSTLAVRSLGELGYDSEADEFRRFIERSSAGNAEDLQILFGAGGERRLEETELDLEGYQRSRPVRIGNGAADQLQLDCFGQLLDLAWRWHRRGHSPDDDYWRFIVDLVDHAVERFDEPDRGLWEWRAEPRHFVHSKVMCWVAVDRGLSLAKECMRRAPTRRWQAAAKDMRAKIERRGFDRKRQTFRAAFDADDLDSAALRFPVVGFLDFEDERMLSTVDALREELDAGEGMIRRYNGDDGMEPERGAFVASSFWLAETLARQNRIEEARGVFDSALATANGLGLFAEEYDTRKSEMRGNFPQGLSHLAHIEAALALRGGSLEGAAGTGSS